MTYLCMPGGTFELGEGLESARRRLREAEGDDEYVAIAVRTDSESFDIRINPRRLEWYAFSETRLGPTHT